MKKLLGKVSHLTYVACVNTVGVIFKYTSVIIIRNPVTCSSGSLVRGTR